MEVKRNMWVYWIRLYESKFQASCVVQRMEHDYWMYGMECPKEIEIYKSNRGKYGVRYMPAHRQ
ncbi:hypothetical protein [Paenibacillus sp. FSL W7-1287]|uniref:hypothetical protein n=2 Tax=Paenibacillus TaxID=44249 RepID=UPI0030FB9924